MTNLNEYLKDGASKQARAVLCFVQDFTIEESWHSDHKKYLASPNVARWENCREQGYIISLRSKDYSKQLNIAFFEHRNSDSICAIKWEQVSLNSLTIDTADFNGQCYSDKYDVSHRVKYGQVSDMADWIINEFTNWWVANKNAAVKDEKHV